MRWLLLALVTLQSATCGQKGPLTLPEDDPAEAFARHHCSAPQCPRGALAPDTAGP